MSKLLLVLAVFCLASMVQADTAVINTVLFQGTTSSTCQGNNYTLSQNAGVCKNSMAYYCSNDGSSVYLVKYSDASCNSTFANSIVQFQTTCNGAGSSGLQYTCTNPSAGPALPWSFPPTNWLQATYCWNTTSFKGQCGSSACYQIAALPTGCTKTTFSNQPSSLTGCSPSGNGDAATVFFSDDSCAGTPVGAIVQSAGGCTDGTSAPACPSGNTIPALPTIGYSTWTNGACDSTLNKPTTTYFYDNKCFSSQTFTCSNMVNGTVGPALTSYPVNATAGCYGTPVSVETQATCIQSKDGSTSKKFICSSTPTPTGAAATTGASMVAMVLAAIVALIASLSL